MTGRQADRHCKKRKGTKGKVNLKKTNRTERESKEGARKGEGRSRSVPENAMVLDKIQNRFESGGYGRRVAKKEGQTDRQIDKTNKQFFVPNVSWMVQEQSFLMGEWWMTTICMAKKNTEKMQWAGKDVTHIK